MWTSLTWIEAVDEDVSVARFLEFLVESSGEEDVCEL